jgi:polyhydroxybutyrate depolymerase
VSLLRARVRLALVTTAIAGQLSCGLIREDIPTLPQVADPCATWPAPGLYRIDLGDVWSRAPMVVIPPDQGLRRGVVMLHGAGGTGERMLTQTTFADHADAEGFVVSFPSGTGTVDGYTWNAGSCCGYAERYGLDDVAFLSDLAAALRDQLCLQQVVAVGFSNGAMMTSRWACEGTGLDAAVTVSGPLLTDRCEGPPLPTAVWHGDADPRVPYTGGVGNGEGGEVFPDAQAAYATLAERNGCAATQDVTTTDGHLTCATREPVDGGPCLARSEVCTMAGWGHDFPGENLGPDLPGPALEPWALAWFDEVLPAPKAPEVPVDTDPVDTDPVDTDPVDTDPVDTDPAP